MDTGHDRLPPPHRLVLLVTTVLWLTFACGLPFQNAREARRQARLQLAHVLMNGKLDAADVTTAFDHATQDVIAAATVPCLFLAVCILFLVHQMLKLKRRYNALERDLRSHPDHAHPLTDGRPDREP